LKIKNHGEKGDGGVGKKGKERRNTETAEEGKTEHGLAAGERPQQNNGIGTDAAAERERKKKKPATGDKRNEGKKGIAYGANAGWTAKGVKGGTGHKG